VPGSMTMRRGQICPRLTEHKCLSQQFRLVTLSCFRHVGKTVRYLSGVAALQGG